MVYFLYGKDSFRSKQKLSEILDGYKKTHKSGLNLIFFDCEEQKLDFSVFQNRIRQVSMFKEKKLVVLKNLFSDADLKEDFLKNAKEFVDPKDIIIIYESKEIKASDSLLKFLLKNAKCQESKILDYSNLRNWAKKEIEKQKTKIEEQALDVLLDIAGEDLWQLSNEIQKLANFSAGGGPAFGGGKIITLADVRIMIKSKIETDIFKTIDAIAQKNKKQALGLLHKHIENGDNPLYLLSMISYQFRNLLVVKDLIERATPYTMLAKKSGLHPFVIKKNYEQCRQFDLQYLKKIYLKIFQADLDIKIGKIDPEMALDVLVAGI